MTGYARQFSVLGDVADQYAFKNRNAVQSLLPDNCLEAVVRCDRFPRNSRSLQNLCSMTKQVCMFGKKSFHCTMRIIRRKCRCSWRRHGDAFPICASQESDLGANVFWRFKNGIKADFCTRHQPVQSHLGCVTRGYNSRGRLNMRARVHIRESFAMRRNRLGDHVCTVACDTQCNRAQSSGEDSRVQWNFHVCKI